MRITHQMLSRNYLNRMNTNLGNLTGSNERMSSQRAYNKAYENVSDAGKALKIRKLIEDDERYLATIRDVKGRVAAAEDSLRTVNSLMISAKDRMVEGLNGTMSESDRAKIAQELARVQDEVFQIMNSSYADKYVFSSAGNREGTAPFSKADDGSLLFHGTAVDEMVKDPATGRPATDGGGVYVSIPYNEDNYVDIGFGYALKSDGHIDGNTAFKDTYSGAEAFGYGVTEDGVPKNVYSLLGKMVDDLNNGNLDELGKDLDAISPSMDYLLTAITEIGTRAVTLDNTEARLENEYINLVETQNKLEGIDLSREMINNKDFEMSWMVTLQLGSRILPSSIFDFLR